MSEKWLSSVGVRLGTAKVAARRARAMTPNALHTTALFTGCAQAGLHRLGPGQPGGEVGSERGQSGPEGGQHGQGLGGEPGTTSHGAKLYLDRPWRSTPAGKLCEFSHSFRTDCPDGTGALLP